MPTFKVTLKDPDSDERRICVQPAESEEAAIAILLAREQRKVDYRLTTDEMAAIEAGEVRNGKAMLLTHEQSKPYEVESVEDYTGGFLKAAAEARKAAKGG